MFDQNHFKRWTLIIQSIIISLILVCMGTSARAIDISQSEAMTVISQNTIIGTTIDLGTLGGSTSKAWDINDDGWVVGSSETASGDTHAFIWTESGGMQDLGTLRGGFSAATAINNNGVVVGACTDQLGVQQAFYGTSVLIMYLPPLNAGHGCSATDINDTGWIVGGCQTPSGVNHATRWSPSGIPEDLGTLDEWIYSNATAINNNGQVVGYGMTSTHTLRAFIWTESDGMQDLGTLGGHSSVARGISEDGKVVGNSYSLSGDPHAFIWTQSDGMQDLGTLGENNSSSTAINQIGQIVGAFGYGQAFLWTAEFGMQDLGSFIPIAINNIGQIVGDDGLHAILFTVGPDGDGIPDDLDNAPFNFNPDQSDIDGDGVGDVADPCPNDAADSCDSDGSASVYVDAETGGTVTTPDNSTSVVIPEDALPGDVSVSITDTDNGSTGFELSTNQGNALGISSFELLPPQTNLNEPITIIFSWPDDDNDGWVDDTTAKEDNLLITKDNVAITDKCKNEPNDGVPPDCDTDANTFTIQVTSWSEFVLAYPRDTDEDGVPDNYNGVVDNCILVSNSDQTDRNVDGQGDACDPIITAITAPVEPVNLNNQPVIIQGTFIDPDDGDNHTAEWKWGDNTASSSGTIGQAANTVSGIHTYQDPGVYRVELKVSDSYPAFDEEIYQYIVVYDPDGGFVTGGGWIDSPEGAYLPDLTLTGKAAFGFVSKYKKGATVPTGNTEFQFKVADLNFHSSSYEWLVVTGSDYARFKGTGTINGNGEYKFMIWAGDGNPDTFRIKIWEEDEYGVETVIYDNGFDQEIGGGSIVVHTGK